MKQKLNKPEDCQRSNKVLTEAEKKEIKRIADDKKKKVSNQQIIRK